VPHPTRLRTVVRSSALVLAIAVSPACDRLTGKDEPEAAKEPVAEAKPAEPTTEKKDEKAEKPEAKPAVKVEPEVKAEPETPKVVAAPAPKELIGYVPESAKLVLVADPKAVARSSMFSGSGAFMDKLGDSRVGEVYAAAKTCNLGVEAWSSILVAGDGNSEDNLIVIAKATGIGKKQTLECLAGGINAVAEGGKWTVVEEGGRAGFTVEGQDTRGVAATDDVLLVHGKSYASAVASILDGSGKSAADGALGKTLESVDRSRHIYFAGEPPPGSADAMFPGMKQLSGTIDLSSGIALAMALDFGDVAKAEVTAQTLKQTFDQTRPTIAAMGIPDSVLASVKIEPKGTTVAAKMHASQGEIDTIAAALGKQL
jgi:hypothetical protein